MTKRNRNRGAQPHGSRRNARLFQALRRPVPNGRSEKLIRRRVRR